MRPAMKSPSRQQAIDAFCKGCIYDPYSGDGSWRAQVEACCAPACALFGYRPKTIATRQLEADPVKSEISRKQAKITGFQSQ